MNLEQLTSAVYNNVVDGLKGTSSNIAFSREHVEDSIISERMLIIKEYFIKNLLPRRDLLYAINCVNLDCYPIDKCPSSVPTSCTLTGSKYILHFEMPPVMSDFGDDAVEYIGSKDKMFPFKVYFNKDFLNHKYKVRGANKPYIWIDTTPNRNNMWDAYVFNAPVMKQISLVFIPRDPRQVTIYECCSGSEEFDYGVLSAELEKRVTEKFLRYFRQMIYPNTPNDQTIKP